MRKLTTYQKRLVELIAGGVIYTVVMLLGVYVASSIVRDGLSNANYLFSLSLFSFSLVYLYRFLSLNPKKLLPTIRFIFNLAAYIGITVLSLFAKSSSQIEVIIGVLFASVLWVNAILSTMINYRARNIILNVIVSIYSFLLIIIFGAGIASDIINTAIAIVPLSYVIMCFFGAMKLVFSGLRKQTLVQIIKKTYTIEILYGLVTLTIATSIMLLTVDSSFENFWDALWYCFAVVTTIGFGDFVATSLIGRILTVILGIYGIIVVALITSIIVNFYNETKTDKETAIKETIEKLEKERNSSTQIEDANKEEEDK